MRRTLPATSPPARASRPRLASLALGLALCASAPRAARAYHEDIHTFIARTALKKAGLDGKPGPIAPGAPAALRAALDAHARASPELKAEWARRFPTPAAFDAWAEKELLLLEPSAKVFGIDRFAAPPATLLELLTQGSREPDDDWRNRERKGYDDKRQPLVDAQGKPVPADPALLNMGRLGALSSQAHAHYGLAQVQFSEDPEVLKQEPRRFAVAAGYPKGPIMTLAAEMAQTHLDLSLLAALVPEGGGAELAWYHAGQGMHYTEDVSNQIHTVQVGLYDFFVDAFMARLQMGLLSGGGYLGPMRSLASIGIDILTNHHTLSEGLTRKRVVEALAGKGTPEAQKLVAAPGEDDFQLSKHLDQGLNLGPAPERGEFALAITRALIDASSREGADVYRTTRAIAIPRMRKEGQHFEDNDDPDAFVVPPSPENQRAYADYFALQERAFRRAGTALRFWVALENKALLDIKTEEQRAALRTVVMDRLLKRQLAALTQAEARRADYLKDPPKESSAPERMPAILAVEIAVPALAALLIFGLVRWRRRKEAQGA